MKKVCGFAGAWFALSLLVVPGVLRAHSLIICKVSDTKDPVTGSFGFTVSGPIAGGPVSTMNVSVPVGQCQTEVDIGAFTFTVTETAIPDIVVTQITTTDPNGSVDLTNNSATVTVPEGGDVTVTFTNATVQVGGKGRWTGGGSINPDTLRVTHGFELHCSTNALPNNIEVNWADNIFHLEALTSVTCLNGPITCSNGASVPFVTGTGLGRLNGNSGATITFVFSDAAEPGHNNDFASYVIGSGGSTVLNASGCLDSGNQTFHPAH
jgi:hypothetical protein